MNEREPLTVTASDLIPFIESAQRLIAVYWPRLLLITTISALGTWYSTHRAAETFTATTTFVVNDENASGMGNLGGLLGQLGAGLGSSNKVNLDKVRELSRSYRIVSEVLSQSLTVANENKAIYKHIIDIEMVEIDTQDILVKYKAGFGSDTNSLDRIVLINLFDEKFSSAGASLVSVSYDEKSKIFEVKATTRSPVLSAELSERIYQTISKFYINGAIAQPMSAYLALRSKADSIEMALNTAERRLAGREDRSKGLFLSADGVDLSQMRRTVSLLTLMNAEAIKNVESSGFVLETNTPVFSIIDKPADYLIADEKKYVGKFFKYFILVSLFVIGSIKILKAIRRRHING